MLDRLRDIVDMGRKKGIPVVANGDCFEVKDAKTIEELTGSFHTSLCLASGFFYCFCFG